MLNPDTTYHIFNRANGSEPIFFNPNNFSYFLTKYSTYITPVADTFCYCLMPNHFHFLIRIKPETEIKANLQGLKNLEGLTAIAQQKTKSTETIITQQFSNFFNAYSKAINKQQNRKGSLFMKNFKQKPVTDNSHLKKLVHYIHYNPVEASICNKPGDYPYSSYNTILSNKPTQLKRAEVIDWFDDVDNFIFVHSHPPNETGIE